MLYWEDFTVGRKMEFGAMEVTEEDIIEYATEFDPQPFHIDKEEASEHFLVVSSQAVGILLQCVCE